MLYFIKANGLIILFYLMYVLFLRKETFFVSNRLYLILGLLISLCLPLITFTKTIWIEPTPVPEFYQETTTVNSDYIEVPIQETPIDWSLILTTAYVVICVLILAKIGIEIASFYKRIRKHNQQKEADFTLIHSNTTENPFSFFHYIVINPHLFSESELQHILTHESIHVKQKHSIDVLLGKLFCAVFWVNPIIWLYRKAMLQNLEFIADSETFQQIENKYEYQKTLLKVVTHQHDLSITNQFYQSLIKKRIVMLHTNQSHKRNAWKYATILPLLVGFMLLFQIETVAQVKEKSEIVSYAVSSNYSSIITKNTTDEELKELEETFSNENRKLIISNVKRNKNKEIIEIKLIFDTGMTYYQVLERKSKQNIDDIQIFVKTDEKGKENCGFIETNNKLGAFVGSNDKEAYSVEFESSSYVFFDNDSYSYRESIIKKVLDENIKSLIHFNDKEISKNEASKIKGNLIEEIIEISPNSSSISKYGEKGKNGVVLINSKKFSNNSKNISISWDEAKKISENIKKDKNRLYIINEKEYMHNEIPKGTTISLDGMITELSKEEGIKKYGEKGKNGVLIFEGKSTFVTEEEQIKKVKSEIERAEKEIEKAKLEIKNAKEDIEKSKPKSIELKNGDVVVVLEGDRIKFPGYPTHYLNQLKLEFQGKILEDNIDFFKNYELEKIKDIKIIEDESSPKEKKRIKKIIIETK